MSDQWRRRIHAQRQHLALDRTHRRQRLRRQFRDAGRDAARPGAGRQHHRIGRVLASIGKHDAIDTAAMARNGGDRLMLVDAGAGRLRGDPQRERKLAIVDLMILRGEHRARELAGKVRLAPSRLGGGNPLQRQLEPLLEREMMKKPGLVVGGERNDQRALAAQLHVDTGGLLELLGKRRPARLAVAAERHQGLLAGLGFGAGRQHAGGRVGRARAGGATVEHAHRHAAGGEPPRNPEPDHAGPDDGHRLGSVTFAVVDGRQAAGQVAPPFAGMTQTGSMGLISAASARHPRLYGLMMGIFKGLDK